MTDSHDTKYQAAKAGQNVQWCSHSESWGAADRGEGHLPMQVIFRGATMSARKTILPSSARPTLEHRYV